MPCNDMYVGMATNALPFLYQPNGECRFYVLVLLKTCSRRRLPSRRLSSNRAVFVLDGRFYVPKAILLIATLLCWCY